MNHFSSTLVFKMAVMSFAIVADAVNAANAAGDPGRGARDFRPCVACHSVKPGEHSTGPSLANLWNRKSGTVEGFLRYSSKLQDADVEWNETSLDKWLSAPQQFIPGTSMNFRGIKDAQERADIIAYLKAVSDDTVPDAAQQDSAKGHRRGE